DRAGLLADDADHLDGLLAVGRRADVAAARAGGRSLPDRRAGADAPVRGDVDQAVGAATGGVADAACGHGALEVVLEVDDRDRGRGAAAGGAQDDRPLRQPGRGVVEVEHREPDAEALGERGVRGALGGGDQLADLVVVRTPTLDRELNVSVLVGGDAVDRLDRRGVAGHDRLPGDQAYGDTAAGAPPDVVERVVVEAGQLPDRADGQGRRGHASGRRHGERVGLGLSVGLRGVHRPGQPLLEDDVPRLRTDRGLWVEVGHSGLLLGGRRAPSVYWSASVPLAGEPEEVTRPDLDVRQHRVEADVAARG